MFMIISINSRFHSSLIKMEEDQSIENVIKQMMKKAKKASKNGDHNQAIDILTDALTINPHQTKILLKLAKEYRYLYKIHQAKQYLQLSLQQSPKSIGALREYISILRQSDNDIKGCEKLLKAKIQEFPNSAQHYCLFAEFYDETKRKQEAYTMYSHCKQIQPNNSNYIFQCACLLYDQKRYEEATAEFENCIQLDSTVSDYYNGYGLLLYDLKRFQEAEKMFKMCLKIEPDHQICLCSYGMLCAQMGKHQQAQLNFRQSKRICPNDQTFLQIMKDCNIEVKDNGPQENHSISMNQSNYINQLKQENYQKNLQIDKMTKQLQEKDEQIKMLLQKLQERQQFILNLQQEEQLKFEKQNQKGLCKICLDNKATYVNNTCGHVSLCGSCTQNWDKECPLCRTSGRYISVYSSMIQQ